MHYKFLTRVIWRSSTTETKWSIPLLTRSGYQAQVVPSSRAACVLCWYDGLPRIAQTRVGFLSGEREKEQASQKEEVCARATVALTRAQQICFIMGPLDMQGLVGAAMIIGCLKYGASFSGLDEQKDSVFLIRLKDDNLLESPDDSAFLQSLRFSCARVEFIRLLLW